VVLTTPAFAPQFPKAGGAASSLWFMKTPFLRVLPMHQNKNTALCFSCFFMHLGSLMSSCVLILEFLPITFFYNLFIGHSSLSVTSWHPRENLPDLDTLPMIRTCAIFVAGGFLLKKNMRRIGCSTRICHQRFVLRT
jgi:hypothetical protein